MKKREEGERLRGKLFSLRPLPPFLRLGCNFSSSSSDMQQRIKQTSSKGDSEAAEVARLDASLFGFLSSSKSFLGDLEYLEDDSNAL